MTDAMFADPVAAPDGILASHAGAAEAEATPARASAPALPEHLRRVRVEVEIVLGHLRMPLSEVAALREGAVLALERKLGDWVDVAINGRIVARGEVIALDDEPERLGVAIREMTAPSAAAPRRTHA